MKKSLAVILGASLMLNVWLIFLAVGMSRSMHRSDQKARAAQLSEETFRSNYAVLEIGTDPVSTYVRQSDGASLTLSNNYLAVLQSDGKAWQIHWDQIGPRLLRVGNGEYKIWDMAGDLMDTRGDRWKKMK